MASRCAISGHTVKTHQAHGLDLQQLPQAALAQPAPTRPLRPRLPHPPDDDPTATARCRPLNPRPSSNLPSPSLSTPTTPHAPPPPSAAAPTPATPRPPFAVRCRYLSPATSCTYPLRFPFNLFRTLRSTRTPCRSSARSDCTTPPNAPCYRKLTAEIEQRALPHPLPATLGTHQSVGVVDLAAFGTARLGAPDEHGGRIAEGEEECKRISISMALHCTTQNINSMKSIP